MIVNPGIRRFLGSAIQRLFNSASFYAPLTHTAVPQRAATGTTATFTRATTSTWQNNDGYLVTGVAGEIGFPGARRVRNLLTFTEDFSNAAWTKTRATISTTAVVCPDGVTRTTLTIAEDGTAANSHLILQSTPTLALGAHVVSVYAKAVARPWFSIGFDGLNAYFDLGTGVVGSAEAGLTSDIEDAGGGWYRCIVYRTVAVSAAKTFALYAAEGNNDLTFSGLTQDSIYIWGAQLEDVTAQTTQTAGEYVSVGALDYRSDLNPLYLSLPGTAGHYASTPDSVAVQNIVTGALFVAELDLAHGSWTGASNKYLITQSNTTGNQRAFSCGIAAGVMFMYVSLDGATFDTGTSINSTAALPAYFANAVRGKLRYSRTAATGIIQFHYSTDGGATWVQSGTDKASTAGAIFNSNSVVELGTASAGTDPGTSNSGKWYAASLAASLGGTPVVDFNPHRDATTPTGTFTSSTTGETYTINGASSVVRSDYYHGSFVDGVKCFPTDLSGNPIPSTTLLGYQAQGARTNLVWPSEDLTHVRYVSGGGGIAVIADQAIAPDGTTTADQLTASGANGTLIQDLGVIASAAQTFSLYLKRKAGTGNVDITLDGGATWTTQDITTTEWTRCPITQTVANPDVGIRIVTSGDAIYAWGLQCE